MAIRSYFITKDPYSGWKIGGFSVFDSEGKDLLYHIKSSYYYFERRIELSDLSSEQIIATLTYSFSIFRVKQAELSILNLSSNEWINGTVENSFPAFHYEYIIKWNVQSILMKTNFLSTLTTFRYENHRKILATLKKRVFSSFWQNKYDLQIFSDDLTDTFYFLLLTITDQNYELDSED
ncbi:unnamed protein product [Rotaria sp. Silwood1]|nr:unnamed protein product [Rotaria sp. Silwood1]CAF1672202.1 unnamed protein product [Rotaria sp. Silwood1]CAF3869538.1 unnamed protein product [Rotaria sp. Silwood1]CAF3953003.1 unnamed protein product [Rotaria sp. Silwood1]CAF5010048.1 unnamed protein product [Rotaria sp. Silwood1]